MTSRTRLPPGKPKGRHPHKRLSAAFVRSAPPGRYCDGNGLYLYVQKTGAHSGDADHLFQQADRGFQAKPITLEERRSIGTLGVGG